MVITFEIRKVQQDLVSWFPRWNRFSNFLPSTLRGS